MFRYWLTFVLEWRRWSVSRFARLHPPVHGTRNVFWTWSWKEKFMKALRKQQELIKLHLLEIKPRSLRPQPVSLQTVIMQSRNCNSNSIRAFHDLLVVLEDRQLNDSKNVIRLPRYCHLWILHVWPDMWQTYCYDVTAYRAHGITKTGRVSPRQILQAPRILQRTTWIRSSGHHVGEPASGNPAELHLHAHPKSQWLC
jgi:hypothetical protein